MTTFTWNTGTSGDWASSTAWSPVGMPDGSADAAVIASAGSYTVTIGSGETQLVNSFTIGNNVFGFGAATPTLDVAGMLQLTGSSPASDLLQGGLLVDAGGVIEGSGLLGASSFSGFSFVNNGTLIANAGTNTNLAILTGFTNNGTVLANSGQLLIEGPDGLANLSGTTLTGGSYIVQGPAAGTSNQIEIGFNFTADIVVDAANIVLDGRATQLQGYVGGSFQPLEQQLQTIASNGSLQLLDGRGYSTSNALTDAGLLNLQGGSLTTGGLTVTGGLFEGFGLVSGGVMNQGGILATGGALDIPGSIGGTGSLTVASGRSLILEGAAQASISYAGVIYNTAGLLDIDALSGSGTLVVQNGGTIDLGVATSESVVFAGSNATLILGTPLLYSGTLAGFGLGDSLMLNGITADAATIVAGNTLELLNGGLAAGSFHLAGDYTGAGFAVAMSGSSAVVSNTSGAPVRDDMPVTVSLNDTAGLSGVEEDAIVNVLSAAAADWGQYITGHAPLRIQLNINTAANGSELASGGPGAYVATGQTIAGHAVFEPSSIYALTTGNYAPNSSADIIINLPASSTELAALFVNPDPYGSPTATGIGQFDLLSVFRHELAHGLGFIGLRNTGINLLGSATLFDLDSTVTPTSGLPLTSDIFTGSNAEAAYGAFLGTSATPVPLTILGNGEAYYHLANSDSDPLRHDLMNGIGLSQNTSVDISSVDLAMLQDVGAPVTAGIVCYARGTRIATPSGEVPVETLRAGDMVLTADGAAQPIVWIGRRHIDCRRHPTPERIYPVRIRAHAFGQDLPRRDLLVSPQHALFIEDVLIPARCLVNGSSVAQMEVASVDYFHIELPCHDLLLAEGMPAESYLDCGDRGFFENGGAPLILHPDLLAIRWEGAGVAPLKVVGPEVEAARLRLAEHAALACLDLPQAAAGG
jgi:hypothetical protein